jgi:hypothetical protein
MFLVLGGCQGRGAGGERWYKGNLHTHTLWSDGDDFPEPVADWYRASGYHFLAISDHDILLEGERWISAAEIQRRLAQVAMDKYLSDPRWQAHTRGDRKEGTFQIRLRNLDELRARFEQPGRFILIPSEEISASAGKLPVHINATNIAELIKPRGGNTVREVMENNLRAVREQSARLNRPILPHINHPNFRYAITAEDLAAVVEERFFEVYNGHPLVNHLGDDKQPSVERIWDIANTIRLAHLKAPPLMGLATDDSHNYNRPGMSSAAPGRGWVMVRAGELTAEALIQAMERGEFYSSSGVTLRHIRFSPKQRTLEIEIEPDGDEAFMIQFIGTPRSFDLPGPDGAVPALVDNPRVGVVLATAHGLRARYRMTGEELYVRALITSTRPAANPVYKDQLQQAWTQPVGWEPALSIDEVSLQGNCGG